MDELEHQCEEGKAEQHLPIEDEQQIAPPRATGRKEDRRRRPLGRYEWLSIIVQAGTLITLGLYTAFSCGQWHEMKRLNDATERTATTNQGLMQASIQESRRQAEAADRQAKAADTANGLVKDSVALGKRQTDSSIANAAESLRLARESLEESRRGTISAQRARLAVKSYQFSPVQEGTFTATAVVVNTGVFPARNVQSRALIMFESGATSSEISEKPEMKYCNAAGPFRDLTDVIGNGVTKEITASIALGFDLPAKIRVDELFFAGCVRYEDGFGSERAIRFCQWYGNEHLWRPCFFGNETE